MNFVVSRATNSYLEVKVSHDVGWRFVNCTLRGDAAYALRVAQDWPLLWRFEMIYLDGVKNVQTGGD